MYQEFLEALRKDFDLSDCGELSWLLGCKVEQEPGKVRLHQEKYCNDILKRDHAGGKDRRSVSGWAVMMNGAMVCSALCSAR